MNDASNAPSSLDLEQSFGHPIAKVLERFSQAALEISGASSFLVGGAVRDALLGVESADIDVMIEGDGVEFVRGLYSRWQEFFPDEIRPKKPIVFKKYGTAKLRFESPLVGVLDTVDFSSARAERYPNPGLAPEILSGDLQSDLERRDFSINAFAVRIGTGEIIDRFSGYGDLRQGRVEILHENSFLDDPVRLLRATRFCSRFEMTLGEFTASRFEEAVNKHFLNTVTPARRFDELRKLLADAAADASLLSLQRSGLLSQIHPSFSVPVNYLSEVEKLVETLAGEENSRLWMYRFKFITQDLSSESFSLLLEELAVPSTKARDLASVCGRD